MSPDGAMLPFSWVVYWGKMLSTLNSRAQQIEGQQSGLQGLASAQQTASNSATGIASYMRMFSL